jgi:hypothetical protein
MATATNSLVLRDSKNIRRERTASLPSNNTDGINRNVRLGRMRDLIINNFMKKHMQPIINASDQTQIEEQIKMTKIIANHVD